MHDNCPDNCPVLPRVEALEEANKQHSATHREMFKRLGELETATAVQDTKLDTIEDKLDDIQTANKSILAKVEALEAKPGKRWETFVAGGISGLGGAFLMWVAMGMPGVGA